MSKIDTRGVQPGQDAQGLLGAGAATAFSRRGVLGAGLAAGIVAGAGASVPALAARPRRTLIKGALVVAGGRGRSTPTRADILVEGTRIAAIGPNLSASSAKLIDGRAMIASPGFIDTHRHLWQGAIRRMFPNATLGEYFGGVLANYGPQFRPEDVYIGNLVSSLSAIDAGITNILDWSHIQNTPAHTDAAIAALQASGIRAVFGYGTPQIGFQSLGENKDHRYPQDIKRLRRDYFASNDQLLTLALAADGPSFGPVEPAIAEWKAAREVAARITVHVMGPQTLANLKIMHAQGLLRDDTTYVHCTGFQDEAWQLIKDTGGTISIASSVEMQMGHGTPAIQHALDHGIRPSLSVDVETSAPNDMYTQMRSVLALQREQILAREAAGEKPLPPLLTTQDVFEFATIEGARANGLEAITGSLEVGKQADIVLTRTDRINVIPAPEADPVATLVLGVDSSNVDTVMVAGKLLKAGGKLVGVDLPSLATKASASQHRLQEAVAAAAAAAPPTQQQ